MKRCKECGKKLSFFGGFRHPIHGRNSLICSNCFDVVHDSIVKWRDLHLPYINFFNNDNSKKDNIFDMKKVLVHAWRLNKNIN